MPYRRNLLDVKFQLVFTHDVFKRFQLAFACKGLKDMEQGLKKWKPHPEKLHGSYQARNINLGLYCNSKKSLMLDQIIIRQQL